MSCGFCEAVAIPGGEICPECLVKDFESCDIKFDIGFLDLYTRNEIDDINASFDDIDPDIIDTEDIDVTIINTEDLE